MYFVSVTDKAAHTYFYVFNINQTI